MPYQHECQGVKSYIMAGLNLVVAAIDFIYSDSSK